MQHNGTRVVPGSLTPLVGREVETEAVRVLLAGDARIVTLTGPGGIGKTRLAIEVVDHASGFPDGRWFVALAPIRDPRLVLPTIARTLDLQETGGRPIDEQLLSFLAKRHALLVLDNVEQIPNLAPVVAGLLDAAPSLQLLATSRAPLRISGEYEFAVSPLTLPIGEVAGVETVAGSEAVALFVGRARAVRPDFTLTSGNAAPVAEICRRLDGLPLAIELAAARVKVISPSAILSRLTHSLALLTGGPTDQPARLRSLRDAIAWSYDLLTPDEQSLFRTLSVFAGSFSLDAAEYVGRESGARRSRDSRLPTPDSDLDNVSSLVDKSLLVVVDGPEGETRCRLLETVREFGLERLGDAGELDLVRRRHAQWIADFVEGGAHHFSGPGEATWARRLTLELDNVRAALAWAIDCDEIDIALRIAGSLSSFWVFWGYLSEGREWLARALAIAGDGAPGTFRARALSTAGMVAWASGDVDVADDLLAQGLALHRALGESDYCVFGLMWRSQVAWYRGDLDATWTLAEQAIATAGPITDVGWVATAHTMLGIVAMRRADPAARTLLEQAVGLHRRAGFSRALNWTLQLMADLAHDEGNLKDAALLHQESLTMARDSANQWALFEEFVGIALLAYDRGLHRQAARLMGAAEAMSSLSGVLPRAGREPYERALAAVRTALGPATFDTEFAAGRALPPNAAADEAATTAAAIADDQPAPSPRTEPIGKLSPRELEVLRLFAAGYSDREVADTLFISHGTARTHTRNILAKLGLNSRAAAVAYGLQHGLI